MSNLSQEIEKNKQLKDNLSTIKSQLNEAIIGGGGTNSTTLAEMPDKIKQVMESVPYTKFATGTYKFLEEDSHRIGEEPLSIPINLQFTPTLIQVYFKKVFITAPASGYTNMTGFFLDSRYSTDAVIGGRLTSFSIFISDITSSNFKIQGINDDIIGDPVIAPINSRYPGEFEWYAFG